MKAFSTILMSLLHILVAIAQGQDPSESAFQKANDAYNAGEYSDALENYKSLIESDKKSFELYFNLGNTYYRMDSIGKAMLYYERARKIDPNSEDLLVNIQIVKQQLIDQIEPLPNLGVDSFWAKVTATSKIDLYASIAMFSLYFAVGFYLFYILLRKRKQLQKAAQSLMVVALAASVLGFALGFLAQQNAQASRAAIVMADEAMVLTAPQEDASSSFSIHEGTKVKIESVENGWMKVSLANGSVGWIESDVVEGV